jgi:hypothetical protein
MLILINKFYYYSIYKHILLSVETSDLKQSKVLLISNDAFKFYILKQLLY